MGSTEASTRRATTVALVVVTAVLAVLAVTWAAATPRPEKPILSVTATRTLSESRDADTDLAPRSEINARKYVGPRTEGSPLGTVLGWLAVALVAGAVLTLVAVALRALLRSLADRAIEADDTTGPDVERVAEAVAADAEGRLRVLAAGSPAEGVVAAWTRLEDTLREVGVPLPASRTSGETTVTVLRRYAVDESALQLLAGLYREAAWSVHPLQEEDRERAESALRALDATLAAASATGTGRRG